MTYAKTFPTKAMEEVFNLGVWSVPHAAWIFAGYSPLHIRKIGHLIRLVDDEPIPFGSLEYREAEKDMHRIAGLLYQELSGSMGVEFVFEKDRENNGWVNVLEKPDHHLERNWLIDQVVNFIGKDEIPVWWVDKLIEIHWLPAWINPDALTPTMLETRGVQSYVYPSDGEDSRVLRGLDEASEEAKFFSKGVKARSRFYSFLQQIIEIEFMGKKLSLPTAKELYNHLQGTSENHKDSWEIWREDHGDRKIHWKELNPPKDKRLESNFTKLSNLSTLLLRWYGVKPSS
jgi:hypothetical protein